MPRTPQIAQEVDNALQKALDIEPTHGNAVQLLQNGSETFPAMLKAITEAQHSITFENYRFWSDATGWKFAHAMAERAQAGVNVHIVYDGYGSSSASDNFWDYLTKAGADVRTFRRPPVIDPSSATKRRASLLGLPQRDVVLVRPGAYASA